MNSELRIHPHKNSNHPIPLRYVRSAHIGRLVTVQGIVTRITEVKPLIKVATYNCDQCGFEVFQTV